MLKLKKGDEVILLKGKDKGKKGKIEKIYKNSRTVLLPGLNIYKRHMKKRDEKNPGGIIDFPRPVSISNVALICKKCQKPTRVGFAVKDGKKQRICRKCSKII